MILIFNTIIDLRARDHFSRVIADRITGGKPFKIIYLSDKNPDPLEYTHLIISGSELSAADGSEWDDKIISVIRSFLDFNKPILGICHGHQMLARAIAGKDVCRKAEEPEFGWKRMRIKNNPLFKGLSDPVFLESRYDQVFDFPDEFNIIASNDKAEIQAFQFKDLPVWGVQFHPEMIYHDGSRMLLNHLSQNTQDREFFISDLGSKEQLKQNLLIFNNFLTYLE